MHLPLPSSNAKYCAVSEENLVNVSPSPTATTDEEVVYVLPNVNAVAERTTVPIKPTGVV